MCLLLGLIVGGVKLLLRLFRLVFRFVYGICKLFRIRLLVLYLLTCGIVQWIFSPFHGFGVAYFWAGFATCALVTVYGWARLFQEREKRRQLKKEERKEKKKIKLRKREERAEETVSYPRYFEVDGYPDYTFAEYEDRYELFVREASGYTYVRTDYKQAEEAEA